MLSEVNPDSVPFHNDLALDVDQIHFWVLTLTLNFELPSHGACEINFGQ